MYIGVDDTDSVKGMCTTYLATELIREFSELDLIGNPRLVRLNPNVPWKTRGNGAVCLRFGRGLGKPVPIGEIDKKPIYRYDRGIVERPTEQQFERACDVVERLAMFDDENTNPGIVMSLHKPPEKLYWQAVRNVVTLDEHLSDAGVNLKRGYKNKRGLIGSVSAISWRPKDRTYELIAYRAKDRWGKSREIDAKSVIAMDRKVKTTFNNYDHEEKHMAIAPNSPCPILYGIRGDVEKDLHKAAKILKSERKDRWLIYLTNHGTDDHIIRGRLSDLVPYTSVKVGGTVASMPRALKGGHLIFELKNNRARVDCTIYEPAKGFREVGGALRPGDRITVFGGIREKPFTINVEKLRIEYLVEVMTKTANPMCKKCEKRMKSAGTGQGYRCVKCKTKAPGSKAEFTRVSRGVKLGWYEPPVGSRRHLSKPLKRMRSFS